MTTASSTSIATRTPPRCPRYVTRFRPGRCFTVRTRRDQALWVGRGIRGIQNFDGHFELTEEARAFLSCFEKRYTIVPFSAQAQTSLYEMLKSDTFSKLVSSFSKATRSECLPHRSPRSVDSKMASNASSQRFSFSPFLGAPTPQEACRRSSLLTHSCAEHPHPSRSRQEFERYADDPDYTIINIPPTVMFKAKVFQNITHGLPRCLLRYSIRRVSVPSSRR